MWSSGAGLGRGTVCDIMNIARHRFNLIIPLLQLDENENNNAAARARVVAAQARRRAPRPRRWWIRPWLDRRVLRGRGAYAGLMRELQRDDVAAFRNFLRVEPRMFQEILERLIPRLEQPRTCNYREAIEPGMKLAITLRYYASGDSYKSLMYLFRVSHNNISKIVRQVSTAIIAEFAEEVPFPTSEADWKEISKRFNNIWNFPQTLGAIDGKHVRIRKPKRGGSLYYNYKGFHSIILMGLVDADYKFIWSEVGANGACSDTQVFNNSDFKTAIENRELNIPLAQPVVDGERPVPYYFIGDDAFALRTWLMKPYALRDLTRHSRIFNYRLSRARRVVENGFGILGSRFRCFGTCMGQEPATVGKITLACLSLHNLMRLRYPTLQNADVDVGDLENGRWRDDVHFLDVDNPPGGNRAVVVAKDQRDYLRDYVNSPGGSVPWQDRMI